MKNADNEIEKKQIWLNPLLNCITDIAENWIPMLSPNISKEKP